MARRPQPLLPLFTGPRNDSASTTSVVEQKHINIQPTHNHKWETYIGDSKHTLFIFNDNAEQWRDGSRQPGDGNAAVRKWHFDKSMGVPTGYNGEGYNKLTDQCGLASRFGFTVKQLIDSAFKRIEQHIQNNGPFHEVIYATDDETLQTRNGQPLIGHGVFTVGDAVREYITAEIWELKDFKTTANTKAGKKAGKEAAENGADRNKKVQFSDFQHWQCDITTNADGKITHADCNETDTPGQSGEREVVSPEEDYGQEEFSSDEDERGGGAPVSRSQIPRLRLDQAKTPREAIDALSARAIKSADAIHVLKTSRQQPGHNRHDAALLQKMITGLLKSKMDYDTFFLNCVMMGQPISYDGIPEEDAIKVLQSFLAGTTMSDGEEKINFVLYWIHPFFHDGWEQQEQVQLFENIENDTNSWVDDLGQEMTNDLFSKFVTAVAEDASEDASEARQQKWYDLIFFLRTGKMRNE